MTHSKRQKTAAQNGPLPTSERLFEIIRDRILYGDLPPGSKITEAALANAYGVNRAPLREAFLRLGERRLIERVPFSGTRVLTPSTEMVRELFEIREVLEGFACRKVAQIITDVQADELMGIAEHREEMITNMADLELTSKPTTLDIHQKIAEFCGNAELKRILSSDVWMYLRANFRQWDRSAEKKRVGAAEHRDIAKALKDHDGELAELLMRRHIVKAKSVWESEMNAVQAGASGDPLR